MKKFISANQEDSIQESFTCSRTAMYTARLTLNAYTDKMNLLTHDNFKVYVKVNKAVKIPLIKQKGTFNVFSADITLSMGMSIEPFFSQVFLLSTNA